MTLSNLIKSGVAAIAVAATFGSPAIAAPAASAKSANSANNGKVVVLSIGRGEQINLPVGVSDVVVSSPNIADVDVRSPRQLYIFGKSAGETTVYATDAAGRTVYTATVRVGQYLNSIDQMLQLAMPEADITVTTMSGIVLLTGTVAQPEDIAEAENLVRLLVGDRQTDGDPVRVVSRLKTAVPQQVNLQVRIAEVSRSLAKEIASNFTSRDNDGNGLVFGIGRGRNVGTIGDINTSGMPR
ncbi:MAG: pilus assembly protein N-terminal domain-containing protein, partial [Sphingomonadales bacterium]|nr:pilus assembly protein N-terminal domain-containing protein [Sphingomonadales bacterium]